MNQSRFASVILPVHNQAPFIGSIVHDHLAELTALPRVEVILVENGSSDDTLAQCVQLGKAMPSVRVIISDPPGWGNAVVKGIQAANGDLICYTNSARTLPVDLKRCLLKAFNGDIVVKGRRTARDNRVRALGSAIYNLESRILFGLKTRDINGTPKVFPKEFEKLSTLSRRDDLLDLEFAIVCEEQNYPLVEVPLSPAPRLGGHSTTGVRSALHMYGAAYSLWRELHKSMR